MTGTCAHCGEEAPARKLYPPLEWVDYLREERGLPPPEGVLAIPLCGRCHDRIAPLRAAFRRSAALKSGRREAMRERVDATLDRLDLGALRDERGPSPDEVRRLYDG